MVEKKITPDDIARRVRRVMTEDRATPSFIKGNVVSGGAATNESGFKNPMRAPGDLLQGGIGGVANRLIIGTSGQVLTVVAGKAGWATSTEISDFAEASEDTLNSTLVAGNGMALTYNDPANTLTIARNAVAFPVSMTVNFDGGGSVIQANQTVYSKLTFAATVTSWEIVADVSGSIVVHVDRAPSATPTVFTTISGTAHPTLSSQQTNKNTSLAAPWSDVTLDLGDWLRFIVFGVPTSVKLVAIALDMTRTVT
jgi:hypothetical protein